MAIPASHLKVICSRARKGSQTHPLLHPSQLLLVEGILLVQVGLFRLQLLRLRAHTHAKNVMGEVAREPVKTKSAFFNVSVGSSNQGHTV